MPDIVAKVYDSSKVIPARHPTLSLCIRLHAFFSSSSCAHLTGRSKATAVMLDLALSPGATLCIHLRNLSRAREAKSNRTL